MTSIANFIIASILVATSFGRTHRYQMVTHENGTKELLGYEMGVSPSPDIRFLAQDLNASLSKGGSYDLSQSLTTTEPYIASTVSYSSTVSEETNAPLLNQLNSYTSNGWTGQKNAVYANSTKLTVSDDGAGTYVTSHNLVKKARSENFTETPLMGLPIGIDETDADVWQVIERLYDCFYNYTAFGSTVECLKTRVTSIFYKYLDESLNQVKGKNHDEKSLKIGKKVLKGALLPLLVLLVIKYLVALPVLAAGLVTIKTFWLSLLSAGVAAFGAPWRHQPQHSVIKRYRPSDGMWSQPPWTLALHSPEALNKVGTAESVTDKYFM